MSWSLIESPFSIEFARAYEGLFTQGSGYFHVRGSIEEHLSKSPQNFEYMRKPANVTSEEFPETKAKWGTYVPGIYGRHPLLNWELVNLPWFLGIESCVDDEKLDMELCHVDDYKRELCFRSATLTRRFSWRTSSGNSLNMFFERFASVARPHLFVQRVSIDSSQEASVALRAGIDADVRTNGYDHFRSVKLSAVGRNGIICNLETDGDDTVAVQTELVTTGIEWRFEETERQADLVGIIVIPPGGRLVLEKRTAITTSRDLDASSCRDILGLASKLTYEELHAEHSRLWSACWDRSDVVIEGDEESQLAMRSSIYHLLRAHVPNDHRVAIDAKGYAGDAYFGRFFWDTEMYLLPFYLYTEPSRARTLIDFRIHALRGAKETAARYGYAGARYPWEADRDGRDSCPNWQYGDHEVHVSADVVYGIAHYATASNNGAFLANDAAEVIVETARYWMQRIDWRDGDNHPSLLGVMGPDEYNPITNNNSYTNGMVRYALRLASEIGEHAGASSEERASFAHVADSLPVVRRADGLVLECEGFESLAEPRFSEFWKDRSSTFASQVSQERLYRTKCLKQADVLMLMALFPKQFTIDEVAQAWNYYLPYTTHDSSLSAGVHAIVACRLGMRDEAWKYWKKSSLMDLDFAHGGAAEGIHIANAGANWQIAVIGFAGMSTAMDSDTLTLRPSLPESWSGLGFQIVWKGIPVDIEIAEDYCTVTNRGNAQIDLIVWDREASAKPGEMVRLPACA